MSARDDYDHLLPENPWGPVTFEYVGPRPGATGSETLYGIFKPSRPVTTDEIVWMCRLARHGVVDESDLDVPRPGATVNEAESEPASVSHDDEQDTGDDGH